MLKFIALSLLITNAFAGHLDTVCEQATKYEPIFDSNYVARPVSNFKSVIETLDGQVVTETAARIRAIVRDGTSIWALTPTQLVQVDIKDGNAEYTYNFEGSEEPTWGAISMVQFGRKLVITRGGAGIMAFDMDTQEVSWVNRMGNDEGWPAGITTNGAVLYVATATSVENGFTGVLTIDPNDGKILKSTKYDVYRWGVIATDAKAHMAGENLVLNNGGWIHLITKKQLEDKKDIRPRWVAQMVPASGQVNAHYLMMAGDFIMHDGQVMGCGVYTAEENSQIVRKSKLVHLKLP